ncbi:MULTISPECIES: DJ-1/PfpI family protein [unclassified Haladaptatus]|uniref:DJ-1/PfpI family protein n=1 Tax=unclassified Haladaptatus TaxID=2622732 RepID=UPI00209BE2C4|nr:MULTISPECIES: DJ-1/PfpI family protein [unclassified Haladaptatus]MCO8245463.1 DJ-1/PfpI family protein [Haladaptatus sp. AB643]MCO8256575.1 DJ-1/PfpI family protein [Haladaptatus sp. AB618]
MSLSTMEMRKRLGIYVFDGVEVVDFTAPVGVFAVAQRMDPELEVFLIGDSTSSVKTTANMRVTPRYSLDQNPTMDAFLIPGGIGTRREMHNKRLHEFIQDLPDETLLVSVCTGSWIYGKIGLLDDRKATNRKHGDPSEETVPIERLAEIAPDTDIDEHRVVDTGRIMTAGGISSGIEMGFHLLSRFGYDEEFITEVAYIMEYDQQWELMKDDLLVVNDS